MSRLRKFISNATSPEINISWTGTTKIIAYVRLQTCETEDGNGDNFSNIEM